MSDQPPYPPAPDPDEEDEEEVTSHEDDGESYTDDDA
jgi:hypothetical protein